MENLTIYNYHPVTGELLSTGEADRDQLLPDNWLIPAHATEIKPPEEKEKNKAVCFIDNEWRLVDDYRGQSYWLEDGSKHVIKELGETLPVDALTEEPPEPPLTAEQIKQARAIAYSNPTTGSDRHFIEAQRKRATGDETGAQEAEQLGVARVEEIKQELPLPQ